MKTKHLQWAASGLATLALLAACGGGGSTPSGDTTAPVATLTAPLAFAVLPSGNLQIIAAATDNAGVISAIEIQVDGVQVGATGAFSPYSVDIDTSAYVSGQHVVRTRARDAAGNVSAWASATAVSAVTPRAPPETIMMSPAW